MDSLQLVKSETFGTIQCDIYAQGTEFWMTRDQIGRALEYADPANAIAKIHQRNRERLDKFSGVVNLSTPGGMQETVVYSARGIYEICRWSRQPKANAFYDWVYDLLEGLRTGRIALQNAALDEYLAMSEEERAIAYFQNRKQLKQLAPKAEMFDRFMAAENAQTMAVVAKTLGTGRDRLFRFLREIGILMANNVPYQQYLDRGYFRVIEKVIRMGEAEIVKPQTLVTTKGVAFIAKLLKSYSA